MTTLGKFLREERARALRSLGITPRIAQRSSVRMLPEPRTLANQYAIFLRKLQKQINAQTREVVDGLIPLIVSAQVRPQTFDHGARFDQTDSIVQQISGLRLFIGQAIAAATPEIGQRGELVAAFNTRKYERDEVFRVLGLNSLPSGTELDAVTGWTRENVKLIENINEQQINTIESFLLRGVRDQSTPQDLLSLVLAEFDKDVNRATLIAIDQTQKLNGQLDRVKQTTSGITGYRWGTSNDERVRTKHMERNNHIFSWDPAAPNGLPAEEAPGQPVRCRCQAIPDVEGMLVSLGI